MAFLYGLYFITSIAVLTNILTITWFDVCCLVPENRDKVLPHDWVYAINAGLILLALTISTSCPIRLELSPKWISIEDKIYILGLVQAFCALLKSLLKTKMTRYEKIFK